jgi:predicted DNA binding CopG/RHH family protein
MQEQLKKPSFKNEAEEAEWWDKNQVALAQEFERAAAEGTLGRGTVARKGKTPTTTIRLDPDDILRARTQAGLKGLRYQTYLKMLIHEALQLAERRLRSSMQQKVNPTVLPRGQRDRYTSASKPVQRRKA